MNPGTYIQDITELDVKKERTTQLLKSYREKTMEEKEDMVNSPSHYNYGGIECIDAIHAMLGNEGFVAYCKGSALKYTWRSGLKFDSEEDLKKAVWYTRMSNGDDPRTDPNESLRTAASLYHKAIADGTLTTDE